MVNAPTGPSSSIAVKPSADLGRRIVLLDVIVFVYTAWVGLFTLLFYERMPSPGLILGLHGLVLAAIVLTPARGSHWEVTPLTGWKRPLRDGLRFFRYSYPLLLILFYFEEGAQTVNAMWADAPHWFEPYLYAADEAVFGVLPAVALNPWVGPLQDEILHGFYFSYYLILLGGVVTAWMGRKGERAPGAGFQTTLTSVITAFFFCFIWYPFLPARGPWENPELMAGMTPFEGFVFVPLIERIIQHGAVSGGCFPSSHVAGAWGIVFGLLRFHRKRAFVFGFFALGMSVSCVYTRYHHGIAVPVGFVAAALAALVSYELTGVKNSTRKMSRG